MARIRTIKPDFWEDELIASLSRDARLLFIATWNLADDEGRLRWSAAYIKSKVFPYDEDLDVKDVNALMVELESSGRVLAYTVSEHITQTFAFVVNFPRHQRINRAQDSSLPPPPDDGGSAPMPFTERSVNAHGATIDPALVDQSGITEGSTLEGKGKEGNGREGRSTPSLAALALSDPFPAFWAAYPRKVDKRTAEKAYRAALKRGADADRLLAAAQAYAASQRGNELRFVKHPSTWLNAEAYDNQPEMESPRRISTGDQRVMDAQSLKARFANTNVRELPRGSAS
ncbi:MAG: hypothetical protein JWO67_4497 [Streptosporangiaceae bacterium]|nr:hypothetical protein [Streptosporangiaceae bacterium]